MSKTIKIILYSIIFIVVAGCQMFEEKKDKPPKSIITVHRFVSELENSDFKMKVPSFKGKNKYVYKLSAIHSRNIVEVKLDKTEHIYEGKPTYDVYIKVDRRGNLLWSNIGVSLASERLALLIDGKYYHSFLPARYQGFDAEWIRLTQTVDEKTAKGLEKFGKLNYKYYQSE